MRLTAKDLNRRLRGRRIIKAKARSFRTGRKEDPWATDPHLILDDGSVIWFVVDETEVGCYGVSVCIDDEPENGQNPANRKPS